MYCVVCTEKISLVDERQKQTILFTYSGNITEHILKGYLN
jgi:hypothetical protein